jgi:HlyD family secretion protein
VDYKMTRDRSQPDKEINATLGVGHHPVKGYSIRWLLVIMTLIILAAGFYIMLKPAEGPAQHYETSVVQQGDLTVTVAATGSVQPVNQVDVGSELSGTIESVNVDFNDRIKSGQVLARLGTDRLQAKVVEARASLESSRARLEEAKATVLETRLRFQRCEKLVARQLCSGEDLDTTRAAYARAKAQQSSAKAQVAVARATLGANETDLGKAEIRSPINGLVLKRQIEPGQTVAASLQAPILFTLAEDLAHMELHVAIDEADVGKITTDQTAVFTVDAYPERSFPARITQVRFAPQTIEGVVTYETILAVDNSDLALRPGMTVTAVITVQQLKDVILVPNAALRFTPPTTKVTKRGSGIFATLFRRPRSAKRRIDTDASVKQKIWILEDGQPKAIAVKPGASDGKVTELRSSKLKPGQEVIVDAISVKK